MPNMTRMLPSGHWISCWDGMYLALDHGLLLFYLFLFYIHTNLVINLNLEFFYIYIYLRRFMDPLTNGDYPHTMRSLVGDRLPKFSREQSEMIKGSFDFLGLNYYTTNYAAYMPHSNSPNASYLTDSRANLSSKHDQKLYQQFRVFIRK
jgi:hypothetical protein